MNLCPRFFTLNTSDRSDCDGDGTVVVEVVVTAAQIIEAVIEATVGAVPVARAAEVVVIIVVVAVVVLAVLVVVVLVVSSEAVILEEVTVAL